MFYVQQVSFKNCAIYDKMWRNTVDPEKPQP